MRKNYFFSFLLVLFLFVTPKGFAQYCQPTFSFGCEYGSVIDDFVIEDEAGATVFSHLQTKCSQGGYADFTSDSSLEINLNGDSEYDFHVTSIGSNQYISVWIDFDNTGDFSGADDLLFQSVNGSSSGFGTPILGTINIPNIHGEVTTRMRVKTELGSAGSSDSCGFISDGEVHDYTVVISGENPNCLSPSNITLESTTPSTANFNWDDVADGADSYSWFLMNEADHPEEDTPLDSGTVAFGEESVTVTGLSENVYYDFYIRSECDADLSSIWRVVDFYIPSEGANCDNPLEITSLPYARADNTEEYLNVYNGTPGSSCGVDENYLNGYDVVYSYEAEEDDLISIELSELSDYYAGVFVYSSCDAIGDVCSASAVAGPSTDDFGIIDFPVEKGGVYYIVVSSWLSESFDFKLDVKPFTCSELEEPAGDATHAFISGDTVDDLIAEATRPSAVLNWYEDAAVSIEITDLGAVALVDGATYYVTQSVGDCEGPALEVIAEEIKCDNLAIVNYTDAEVTCRGSMTLKAEGSGVGNEVLWYADEIGGSAIGRGLDFETPELTQTTSFWVSEVFGEGMETIEGLGRKNPEYMYGNLYGGDGLVLQASRSFTIVDVELFSVGAAGEMVIELLDDSNVAIAEATINVPAGASGNPTAYVATLNFVVPNAGKYILTSYTDGISLTYDRQNNEFPYSLGDYGDIVNGISNSFVHNTYYSFYNWTIVGGDVLCESSRQEVVAAVDQFGDIQFDHTELPYVDTNDTALFGNNFLGSVGSGCVGNLDGNEAIYHYASDPDEDEILQIELSDVDNPSASIFLYDSCGVIGLECVSGATIESGMAKIKDYYLEAGEDLIILVSASSSTVNYTLTVEGNDCDNITPPSGNSAPYFGAGDTVEELFVDGSIYNEGFVWYKDQALTDEITDLSSVDLIDGESYYVTQTILGCESNGFEVTPIEFECGLMDTEPVMDTYYVCSPGDEVTLEVAPTGIGTEVYWYDAPIDGEVVGKGSSLKTYVDENTSYWATEVFTQVGESVVCESPRQEIPVVLNDEITEQPIVTSAQTICGDSLLSQLIVLGEDIKWYNSAGKEVNSNTSVLEGETYFVTQTIKGCESPMKEVIMNFSEVSEEPVAAKNQAFEAGNDLASLEVHGDNLVWYADKYKSKELPTTTLLVDQTTYYVTQVQEEMCESEPFGITVHATLDIEDVLFEHFEFYPNPVQQILFITNAQTIDQVEIFDLAGKKVFDQKYQDGSIELDVSNLSTGTYLMKAKVDKTEKVFRVIKK